MAATSSYLSFLMHSTDGTSYTNLCPIKEYPDMGGEPELLDTTSLSDSMRVSILGLQDADTLTFTANYEKETFQALKALENQEEYYALWLGGTENAGAAPTPTGSEGKFSFKGMLNVRLTGAGVNEVRDMTISLAASTPIAFSVA